MPFHLNDFLSRRPHLYHLTATSNLPRIQHSHQLLPAAALLHHSGHAHVISQRRPDHLGVAVDNQRVHIRDQSPLYERNIAFQGGWTFARLIEELNHRVFFWPCKSNTPHLPIDAGQNHFSRYASEDCKVLVIDTAALFALNAPAQPEFCPFNSGSPRSSPVSGKSPRGPDSFLPANLFSRNPGKVVEVTFRHAVTLPPNSFRIADPSEFIAAS